MCDSISQELDSETEASLAEQQDRMSRTPSAMHNTPESISSQIASPKTIVFEQGRSICTGKATYSHDNATQAHIRAQSLSYSGTFPEWAEYPGWLKGFKSAPDAPNIRDPG